MLEARNLTLWRGSNCLFDKLSLRVRAGCALLLRGPNGSGKTTLLRVLCGLTQPETGDVRWLGDGEPGPVRGHIAYSGHQAGLNADLTVRQNLAFYGRLPGASGQWQRLLEPLALVRCEDLEVRYLSAGQRRRASLARILMSGLPAWLLDEPFTNLDATGRRLVEREISGHLVSGGLAVIAAHDEITIPGAHVETVVLGGN